MCNILHKNIFDFVCTEKDLPALPVDIHLFVEMKSRVNLARKIDQQIHRYQYFKSELYIYFRPKNV